MNETVILQEIPPCVQATSHEVVFRRRPVTFLRKRNVSIYEIFSYEILVSWNFKTLTKISHYENLAPYGMAFLDLLEEEYCLGQIHFARNNSPVDSKHNVEIKFKRET